MYLLPEDRQWLFMKALVIAFLSIALMFALPYGYYQIMRIALMWIFFKLSMKEYEADNKILTLFCGLGLVAFQPLVKLAFDKTQWIIVDQITILLMSVWIVVDIVRFKRNCY